MIEVIEHGVFSYTATCEKCMCKIRFGDDDIYTTRVSRCVPNEYYVPCPECGDKIKVRLDELKHD